MSENKYFIIDFDSTLTQVEALEELAEKIKDISILGIRSKTVIVINTPNGSQELIKKLSEKGFVVDSGYKEYKDKQIRIANFPMHKSEDIKKMLKLI